MLRLVRMLLAFEMVRMMVLKVVRMMVLLLMLRRVLVVSIVNFLSTINFRIRSPACEKALLPLSRLMLVLLS